MAIDFHGFPLRVSHHETALAAMPDVYADGRNLRDGYIRGLGFHFGNFQDLCVSDHVFMEALELAKRLATPVSEHELGNLYLIMRYWMPNIEHGDIVEFGTHRGGSALFLARLAKEYLPHAKVHCFDSFEGMPDTCRNDIHQRGDFNDRTEHEFMAVAKSKGLDNIVLAKGFFCDTVPRLLPSKVALAHIDCDLYQSVADCYDGVKPKLVPRAYIAFDDPLFSSCIGAFDAVAERVINRDGRKVEQNWPNLIFRGEG